MNLVWIFFRDSNLDEQLAVLKPQLKLAFELDLPVIIHCRDAAQPMIDLLSELRDLDICPKGVMHCWAGDSQEMQAFFGFRLFLSVLVAWLHSLKRRKHIFVLARYPKIDF